MDPLSYFIRTHFPNFYINYPIPFILITYTFVLLSSTVAVVLASQTYAFILLYMTTTLLIYDKLLSQISKIAHLDLRFKTYKIFYILHQIYAEPAAIASGVSLTVGFILSIMLAIVGLQGYDKFPLPIYLYSELTEFTILILVYILLPSTFQVYERSFQMIRLNWKSDLKEIPASLRGKRNQLAKEMKSLRPVYFGFYKILKLTKNWGAAYVFNMMDSIMDGCLTFSLDGHGKI